MQHNYKNWADNLVNKLSLQHFVQDIYSKCNSVVRSLVGAVALAEYIADTRTLLRLDLRENDLFVGGLMALTLAVKINESVVRIDLDKDLKKEQVSCCKFSLFDFFMFSCTVEWNVQSNGCSSNCLFHRPSILYIIKRMHVYCFADKMAPRTNWAHVQIVIHL